MGSDIQESRMRENLTYGLTRGHWNQSDGPLERDTLPKGEKRLGLTRPVHHCASGLLYSVLSAYADYEDNDSSGYMHELER